MDVYEIGLRVVYSLFCDSSIVIYRPVLFVVCENGLRVVYSLFFDSPIVIYRL